jgi:hypothetical protein
MSDSEDNLLNDEDRKPAAGILSYTRRRACAGLKRRATSTRTESLVWPSGLG